MKNKHFPLFIFFLYLILLVSYNINIYENTQRNTYTLFLISLSLWNKHTHFLKNNYTHSNLFIFSHLECFIAKSYTQRNTYTSFLISLYLKNKHIIFWKVVIAVPFYFYFLISLMFLSIFIFSSLFLSIYIVSLMLLLG